MLHCPCHFSKFNPGDGARVADGPAPRPLPALPLALVVLLTAAAAPPSVEKAVGLYRKYDIARTSDYDPDPIFPWIGDNIEKPGVLLAPGRVRLAPWHPSTLWPCSTPTR